jgi:hypothetical protein
MDRHIFGGEWQWSTSPSGRRVWKRKRDKEEKGKARCELRKNGWVVALDGGVCDLKEGVADRHHYF